jgi:hypothetical protein
MQSDGMTIDEAREILANTPFDLRGMDKEESAPIKRLRIRAAQVIIEAGITNISMTTGEYIEEVSP